jgi:hypothetical protein
VSGDSSLFDDGGVAELRGAAADGIQRAADVEQ